MSTYIKRDALCVSTCKHMHDHGESRVRFVYSQTKPLVFTVKTRLTTRDAYGELTRVKPVAFEIYRESVFYWLTNAPAGSVLNLGETTIRVRLSAPQAVVFKLPYVLLDEETEALPMFVMAREWLQRFLADTYAALPAEAECDYLPIDSCIRQILNAGR